MAVPTLIQHVCGPTATNANITSYVLQLPHPSLSGNCIIVAVTQSASGTPPTMSVTDNKGNTYTSAILFTGNQQVQVFVALNTTAGVTTITIARSGSPTSNSVQAIASEFNNIATASAVDVTANGTSAGATSVATSALATTVDGDLIYQVAWQDGALGMTSWTQGTSPFALLNADIQGGIGGCAAQYQVQTTHGSITPSMTMAPSNAFDSVSIALKSASSGTPLPAGMRVLHTYHQTIGGSVATPVKGQFPSTGNLLVLATTMIDAVTISSITDGSSNTYTAIGSSLSNTGSGQLRFFYVKNAATSTTLTGITVNFTGTNSSGDTIVYYDITGADTVAPFDATAGNPTATGTDNGAGNHTISTSSITPSTIDGLCFSMLGVTNSEPINAVTPGLLIACTSVPEASSGDMDENNGWGMEVNGSTSSRTYVYTAPNGAAGNWAAMAVHFLTPSVATVGVQEDDVRFVPGPLTALFSFHEADSSGFSAPPPPIQPSAEDVFVVYLSGWPTYVDDASGFALVPPIQRPSAEYDFLMSLPTWIPHDVDTSGFAPLPLLTQPGIEEEPQLIFLNFTGSLSAMITQEELGGFTVAVGSGLYRPWVRPFVGHSRGDA